MSSRTHPSCPLRILVAEDEAVIGLDLAERLAQAGHSVLGPFMHCAEIEEWIAHDTPDAAILDMRLLDGSCEETVRQLRDRGVPMVAFTGESDIPEDLADMVVVAKPGNIDQVLDALKRLTAR
jgi:DNA-binding response OmpR family regulator